MFLEFPLEIYVFDNARLNYFLGGGTMKYKRRKIKEYKLDAQGILDLRLLENGN